MTTILTEEEIRGVLREGIGVAKFMKANGEVRILRGTTNPNILEQHSLDLPVGSYDPNRDPEGVITLMDLDVQDWRRFRMDRLIEFSREQ